MKPDSTIFKYFPQISHKRIHKTSVQFITRPRPKAGGRVLKYSSFFFLFSFFFGSASGLTLIDKFLSFHILFNGGVDILILIIIY